MAERWHDERFGDYQITARLAVGGMAEIFTARPVDSPSPADSVVIKRILPHLAEDQKFINMFIDEAKLVSRLNHPNIVRVYDYGDIDGRYFIVMEHVRGLDCARLLRRATRRSRNVPTGLAVYIMEQVLQGLDHAHRLCDENGEPLHLIHRDISPSNIFVSFNGDVKLGDFGIAFARERLSKTAAGALKGKLGYLSPEQVAGRNIDLRADLFPAAAVLVELISGSQLFSGSNELSTLLKIRDVRIEGLEPDPDIMPPELWQVVLQALSKRPADRFQTAAEFREALLAVQRHNDEHPTPEALADFVGSALGIRRERDFTPAPPTLPKDGLFSVPEELLDHSSTTPVVNKETFEVRTPSGERIGEFMLAGLIERIVSGVIGPQHRVRTEPGVWQPIGRVRFLARHLSDPDVVEQEKTPIPDFRGDLSKISTLRVLYRFAVSQESGLLIFESTSVRKEVYLVDGRPEFVASNDPRELLGEFLVAREAISRETLKAALSLLPAYDGRLGATLVHMRAVSPVKLFKLLVEQVKAKLTDLFTWRRGAYRFYRGRECPREMFPLGIDSFDILTEGLRIGFRQRELESYVQPYLQMRLEPSPRSRLPLERFGLDPVEQRVLESVSAPTTIDAILNRFPGDRVAALRGIYLGLESEHFRLVDEPSLPELH